MDLTTETASKKGFFCSSLLWWQSVLINSYRWPMSKPIYFSKPLGGEEEQTEYCSHPLLFSSPVLTLAQMCTWTFVLSRGRADVFVVTYLQNYCSLCSSGLMEPALLVNSQNIWPGSDLMQCKSEQCHWCQLSCSRTELLWNHICLWSTAGALHWFGVWCEGGKSFAEQNNTEFVLNYTLV